MSEVLDLGAARLVGLGALNVDFIVRRASLTESQSEIVQRLDTEFEPNSEEEISEAEADNIIPKIAPVAIKSLGGSAFNVIYGVSSTNLGLNLGFIGVAGTQPEDIQSFQDVMSDRRIDITSVVEANEKTTGRCISYVYDKDRALRVAPGANTDILDVLSREETKIADLLSRTRLLHVTSFLSAGAPEGIATFLGKMKSRLPTLTISFDPGHEWCKKSREIALDIARMADYLFVNERELSLLGDVQGAYEEVVIANSILDHQWAHGLLVVLKRYEHIILFDRIVGEVRPRRYEFPRIDPKKQS